MKRQKAARGAVIVLVAALLTPLQTGCSRWPIPRIPHAHSHAERHGGPGAGRLHLHAGRRGLRSRMKCFDDKMLKALPAADLKILASGHRPTGGYRSGLSRTQEKAKRVRRHHRNDPVREGGVEYPHCDTPTARMATVLPAGHLADVDHGRLGSRPHTRIPPVSPKRTSRSAKASGSCPEPSPAPIMRPAVVLVSGSGRRRPGGDDRPEQAISRPGARPGFRGASPCSPTTSAP